MRPMCMFHCSADPYSPLASTKAIPVGVRRADARRSLKGRYYGLRIKISFSPLTRIRPKF